MRIVGGKYRGRSLFVPKGLNVRPTSDRVKESLFNILGPRVQGATVLDLFAGCGALGLEALSRGANKVVFVDRHPASLAAVRRNLDGIDRGNTRVIQIDPMKHPGPLKTEAPYDLIFLDPPYGRGLALRALELLARLDLIRPGALAVVEHQTGELTETETETGDWTALDSRKYGGTEITFFEWQPEGETEDGG